MQQIEIGAPASLPLALVRLPSGAAGLLGASLRYPPLNLAARAAAALSVTGARAFHAHAAARHFLQAARLPERGEVEIELAIPSLMGLGSDGILALGVAQALAWVHDQPLGDMPGLAAAAGLGPKHALETQGYAQGGVLLVDVSPTRASSSHALRRSPLAHPDEAAWVFVLFLPRAPDGAPEDLEAVRLAQQLASVAHLPAETGRLLDGELWPALLRDDIDAFGRALTAIQALNASALEQAGTLPPLTRDEQAILELCRAHGAVACGRSPTGLALFALIRGARPSIALRQKLVERVGIRGGTVLGSIVDNRGARHRIHAAPPIYTGASPLVSGDPRGEG
jgi:predicted sugar kinase